MFVSAMRSRAKVCLQLRYMTRNSFVSSGYLQNSRAKGSKIYSQTDKVISDSKDSNAISEHNNIEWIKWDGWYDDYNQISSLREHIPALADSKKGITSFLVNGTSGRFHAFVSIFLGKKSSPVVAAGIVHKLLLIEGYELTPQSIIDTSDDELAKLLKPARFYKKNSVLLKNACQILVDHHDGMLPNDIDELARLPGVGMTLARKIRFEVWENYDSFYLDQHMYRVISRLRWIERKKFQTAKRADETNNQPLIPSKNKNKLNKVALITEAHRVREDQELIRKQMEGFIQPSMWADMPKIMQGFGEAICTKDLPLCDICPLQNSCTYQQEMKMIEKREKMIRKANIDQMKEERQPKKK